MIELGKTIKVVRLSETFTTGVFYLTACDDERSVTCYKVNGDELATLNKNINWRIQWLPNGKCYLWSCYNKVLAIRGNPYGNANDLNVFQSNWPVENGSSAEWSPRFRIDSARIFKVKLDIMHGYKSFFCERYRFGNGSPEIHGNNKWYNKILTFDWCVHVMETVTESVKNEVHRNYREGNYLVDWKVGQVVFNVGGLGGGYGGYSSHYNSGGNSNGSGTQTNGDVNVYNDFGTTQNSICNFNIKPSWLQLASKYNNIIVDCPVGSSDVGKRETDSTNTRKAWKITSSEISTL